MLLHRSSGLLLVAVSTNCLSHRSELAPTTSHRSFSDTLIVLFYFFYFTTCAAHHLCPSVIGNKVHKPIWHKKEHLFLFFYSTGTNWFGLILLDRGWPVVSRSSGTSIPVPILPAKDLSSLSGWS